MEKSENNSTQQNLAIRLLRVLRYNKARIERCVSLLPDQHKPLFHVIPFLLHVNDPSLPGYIEDSSVPHGLHNYTLRPDVASALNQTFMRHEDINDYVKRIWPKRRCIESVLLMGSVGTIAQEPDSDFDYWVCIDNTWFTPNDITLLQQKVSKIEQWVMTQFNLEVHFFISDINSVKRNDFGIADGESAGSAQAIVLKAEFYATNIVVAGKAPFWWLTPDNTSDQLYERLQRIVKQGSSPDPNWLMDLGNLNHMDPNELFGAAIWQLSKAVDSPFKSVLKMAKLEVFLENLEHQPLLCNMLKKRVHHTDESASRLEPVDPYALMFDQLIEHYSKNGSDDMIALLQRCLYIKCASKLSEPVDVRTANFKHRIMSAYVKKWGWSAEYIAKLDNIESWTFTEQVILSKQVHSFLIHCYRRMSQKFRKYHQMVSQEDMTVLGRRLSTFYSKKDHKIEYLRSSFGQELYCPVVTIKTRRLKTQKHWYLYAGDHITAPRQEIKQHLVREDTCSAHLIAWCVVNSIIDQKTNILLDYDADPVRENDLLALTRNLASLFPSLKVNAIPRDQLLQQRTLERCLVVLNMESSRMKPDLDQIVTIYDTSWGERFIVEGESKFLAICEEMEKQQNLPERYMVIPEYTHKRRLIDNFLDFSPIGFDML